MPPCGRRLVRVNERTVAQKVGCCRETVARAIDDLEDDGSVLRWGRRDSRGLVLLMCGETTPSVTKRALT
jgi:hypothetical protein